MNRIDRDQVPFFVVPVRIDRPANQQLFALQPGIFAGSDNGPDNPSE
jgi:hypothetical protein